MDSKLTVSTDDLRRHISALNEKMNELNYSSSALFRMNSVWEELLEYTEKNPPEYYNEAFRQRFIRELYGHCMGEKYSAYTVTRAIYMLSDFIKYGMVLRQKMNNRQGFSDGYKAVFDGFLSNEKRRGLSKGTLTAYTSRLYRMEHFFINMGVLRFSDITLPILNSFVETLAGYSISTVSEIIREIRLLCDYAYANGHHMETYSMAMPHVKNIRQQRLPSVFTPEEILSLLKSVDRNNPLGKRNYAMILLAVRLGLRISDIRYLEFYSINWKRKTLSIIQKKTGKPLELPLLDDVGWSIIDYLKNGRPKSDSKYVFIRHSPPYTALAVSSHLIVQQMRRAGIESPLNRRIGMHALRRALATSMLEKGVPLPVISHTLGHADIQSTEVYLRISMNQLRQCALGVEL